MGWVGGFGRSSKCWAWLHWIRLRKPHFVIGVARLTHLQYAPGAVLSAIAALSANVLRGKLGTSSSVVVKELRFPGALKMQPYLREQAWVQQVPRLSFPATQCEVQQ